MFETGLRGVEGKPVGLGNLPRRSLSKDEGKGVFSLQGQFGAAHFLSAVSF
jgi:hypothetical protein